MFGPKVGTIIDKPKGWERQPQDVRWAGVGWCVLWVACAIFGVAPFALAAIMAGSVPGAGLAGFAIFGMYMWAQKINRDYPECHS